MSKLKLNNLNTSVELSLNGEYQIKINDFELKNCRPILLCKGKEYSLTDWRENVRSTERLLLETNNELGKWFLEFTTVAKNSVSIQLYGKLISAQKDIQLVVMDLPSLSADHLLAQGAAAGNCTCKLLKEIEKQNFESHYQLMLTRNDSTLQFSFPLRQKQPNAFRGIIKNGQVLKLQAFSDVHNFGLKEIKTDTLTLKCDLNAFTLMEDYADENLEKEKDFSAASLTGWNSWEPYHFAISEEEILKNAEFIANDPVLSKHVKCIIVDDGWQYCYGEWEANHHFPNGMKYLADKITELGFEPGLWFAPTLVEKHAHIAQLDYDMLAQSEGGQPCLGFECNKRYAFLLDPTQEKVQKHLQKLFRRYSNMGYKYFKLDFMTKTMNAKRFADPAIPRSEIPRLIVKSIYEAVHDKTTILACNYHLKGGTDFVDTVRIGSDIHSRWQSIQENAISVAARFWSNKRLWINDPDFALCQAFDTVNDKDINRLQPMQFTVTPEDSNPESGVFDLVDINRPQAEVLLSIVLASAGTVNFSDKMYLLNESGLDLARRTVSAEVGKTAIPLDLFKSNLPAYWLQKTATKHRVLLINWKNESNEMLFDLNKYGITSSCAVNFWDDKPVKIKQSRIKALLKPRSCLFAVIG